MKKQIREHNLQSKILIKNALENLVQLGTDEMQEIFRFPVGMKIVKQKFTVAVFESDSCSLKIT